ncbi:MAG TPA: hypothetical protein VEU76_09430, partial [Candidatus Udaeobacter sp.]|nr:hypothetical protein [Candidatus Udaeobacter sp.]
MGWIDRLPPRTRARITGIVYLLFFLTAVISALIPPGIGGPGALPTDAAATARSIVSQKSS